MLRPWQRPDKGPVAAETALVVAALALAACATGADEVIRPSQSPTPEKFPASLKLEAAYETQTLQEFAVTFSPNSANHGPLVLDPRSVNAADAVGLVTPDGNSRTIIIAPGVNEGPVSVADTTYWEANQNGSFQRVSPKIDAGYIIYVAADGETLLRMHQIPIDQVEQFTDEQLLQALGLQIMGGDGQWYSAGITRSQFEKLVAPMKVNATPASLNTPTPEPFPTWTPMPTPLPLELTPMPEPTEEKPLYWECGPDPIRFEGGFGYNNYPKDEGGRGLPTGIALNSEFRNNVFDMFSVNACLIEVSPFPGSTSDNVLHLKIGFYDTHGEIHIFQAFTGGKMLDGKDIDLPLCLKDSNSQTCVSASASETGLLLDKIISNSFISKQISLDLVRYDRSGGKKWDGTNEINSNSSDNKQLLDAVRKGDGFPEVPQDFHIYVFGITPLKPLP
ncbi:MAG: hypothetical protein UX52_C0030G0004 [Candidatus Amesbacteria bacterium GW2011_GWA1_46_35]|uniref:Uncharacterized protein n=1 Tax=Candidatus Amesbacteria bacterium GW2011_GWC2_45_19 TaxID=1618366 RepID=A0A0G1M3M4_9BACT|nr:MAG: hypothetical protein UX05_C0007G0033 [Candidatus Amesbacteria bacterium GW2011_GWC2_45_19]KKU37273.1 MAG: hypothetical protein UX52_C0030G0004 [Candidatus Amesbacteria bacterium GW2011_GWA1_46_35]KKU68384.1 MAG: hypothetical protein UX93_C0008G0033 [Microgenomates group bacterium GW2011_GWC1_47_20]